ncbi:MAG: glycosyltransferase family 9 protein [Candidatus Ozemobacteraceae bacterium]
MKEISVQRIPAAKNRLIALVVHYLFKACHSVYRCFSPREAPPAREIHAHFPPHPSILLVRIDGLGDLIMSSPIIGELKKRFPDSKITLLTANWSKGVLPFLPGIDETLFFDAPWIVPGIENGWKNFVRTIKDLRRRKFDIAIDLRGDFRNNILLSLTGSPLRIGFDITGCEFFLNGIVSCGQNHHYLHLAKRIIHFLDPKSEGTFESSFFPRLNLPSDTVQKARTFLSSLGIPIKNQEKPLIIIHPGARWKGRQWETEKYAKLADRIVRQLGGNILLTGTADELEICTEVQKRMAESSIFLAGKTPFDLFLGILHVADLFVGVDSGPMHLANALGTPLVALFGPALVETVGPTRQPYEVVTWQKDFSCSPCPQITCPKTGISCMNAISIKDVWQAILKLRHQL